MNKLHPIYGIAFLVCGTALLIKSLSGLTKTADAPKQIGSDISATPVATVQQVVETIPAASGTAQGV